MRLLRILCAVLVVTPLVGFGQSSARIAGVDEPPELTGTPKKFTPPSKTVEQFFEIMEKLKEDDPETVKALRPQLDGFVSQHPDFADGYTFRAMSDACYAKIKNYESASRDINAAIAATKQGQDYNVFPLRNLYALRARFDHYMGNDREAMNDLERAMKLDLNSAASIFDSHGATPEANPGGCGWNLVEVDALIQKFPRDYRGALFRGLFLNGYGDSVQQTIQAFQKAALLEPRSPLSHYFIGRHYAVASIFASDAVRNDSYNKAVSAFTKAIELESTFKEAYVERASVYDGLKQFRQAVKDYDKVLQLDPEKGSAYHDRALVKMDLGEYYSAITDFGDSLRRTASPSLNERFHYQDRANAYMKVGDFGRAIADLNKAIELSLATSSFLMSLQEFRTIYPEYKQVPDETLVKKLQALFFPTFAYEELSKRLLENKDDFEHSGVADLYVKRGDAYLKLKNFRKAFAEYNRAFLGFGEYGKATERWRLFTSSPGGDEFYVDVKTIEFSTSGPARLWLKSVSKDHTHTVNAYEVDCRAKRLNEVSMVAYDANDKFLRSTDLLGGWQRITPDTMGEELFDGMCSSTP